MSSTSSTPAAAEARPRAGPPAERPPRFTLAQLRTFEAVARLGGVTLAAAELHLAQPTVSTQLRELSAALGSTLFEPAGRGLRITPVGRELQATVQRVFAELAQFEQIAAAHHGLARGRLRLAAVTTAEYFVPDLLGPFAQRHPGLAIELAVENRDAVIARLRDERDELAVMMLPPADSEGLPLARWPFLENPLVVVAAPGHPLAARRRVALDKVLREPLLAREPGSGTRLATEQFLAARGLAWAPRMALGSNEAIKHAVAAGLGLAVISRHALGGTPALAELPVAGFPILRRWHLVWRRDRQLSLPAQAFRDHLREPG